METTQSEPAATQRVVVRPGMLQATVYTMLATASTSIALYGYIRRDEYIWMSWAIGLSSLATCVVASQVLAPQLWTLTVDRLGVRGRIAGVWIERSFVGARLVEITRRFGEPRLVVRGHGGPRDRRVVRLPLGADLTQLRALLAELELEASMVTRPGPFDPARHEPPPTPSAPGGPPADAERPAST